jgi:hypothetical protein
VRPGCRTAPARGVLNAVNHGGIYTWPINGHSVPKLQVITVAELLDGKRPQMPTLITPYQIAVKAQAKSQQMDLLGQTDDDDLAANGTE